MTPPTQRADWRVTYLGHSGFLLEWPDCYWLFDWWKGQLPPLTPEKPLLVFVSHRHKDHFSPQIFHIVHPDVRFYLSSDVRPTPAHLADWGGSGANVTVLRRRQHYSFPAPAGTWEVEALPSTDAGVGLLLRYGGKTVYFAGDLNWWDWPGESTERNHNMAANFQKAAAPLAGLHIDLAFAPLDPRQETSYDLGLTWLLTHAQVAAVLPMHFWDHPEVIDRFRTAHPALSAPLRDTPLFTQPRAL